MNRCCRFFALPALLGLTAVALGQTATLSGVIKDASQSVVPGAQITVMHEESGIRRITLSDAQGYYVVPLLQPGEHRVMVRKPGFRAISRPSLHLNVGQSLRLDFALQVGLIEQSVNVPSRTFSPQTSHGSETLLGHSFLADLPLNGRSFHSLVELSPGVAPGKNYGVEEGQFSVNGQRASANYVTIDGVNANLGVSANPALNQPVSLPSFPRFGGTSGLVALDAMQEFRVQTSAYAAECGRTPGAQIAIATRAGTNEFHGAVFDYAGNDALDSNGWFANRRNLRKPPQRRQDLGAVVGGPLINQRAFFFISYEGVRAEQPRVNVRTVPSLNSRQMAAAQVKAFLSALPLPNGAGLGNERAEFTASYSGPLSHNAASLRVDAPLRERWMLFGRYNNALSSLSERMGSLNTINATRFETQTLTIGATGIIAPTLTHDFRVNWSGNRATAAFQMDGFGGATLIPSQSLFDQPATRRNALSGLFLLDGAGSFLVGKGMDNAQRQLHLVDNFSWEPGNHQLKFGVDYRRLAPSYDGDQFRQLALFNNVRELMAGRAALAQLSVADPLSVYRLSNFSAFAQDAWHAAQRLTITYGLRWEFTPPPATTNDKAPYTIQGLSRPATMTLAPQATPLWRISHRDFAPRFGIAYQPTQAQRWETSLRAGAGIFYDPVSSQAASSLSVSFPYRADKFLSDVSYPLMQVSAARPTLNFAAPYGPIFVFDPGLRQPYTVQWNVSVEQALGLNQFFTASYVAAAGRRLLRQELLRDPNPNFTTVQVTRGAASSDYHALQLQFQRRLARGMQAQAAYTWSHALDNSSDDSSRSLPLPLVDLRQERGPSAFDVRHLLSAAITADIPSPNANRLVGALLSHWSVDAITKARSATPINVVTGTDVFNAGLTDVARPDVAPGVPLWLADPTVGGGRRLNGAAFVIPDRRQGTLGRNALRGFGFSQVDLALRRQFVLTERLKLQLRAECFNLFNHPNFGDPVNRLNRSLFGESGYQANGPRSIQLAVKLQFGAKAR